MLAETRNPLRYLASRPYLADGLLALVLLVLSTAVAFSGDPEFAEPTFATIAMTVLSTVPVAVRRAVPLTVLFTVTVAQAAAQLLDGIGGGWFGVVIAAYSLGAHGTHRLTRVASVVWWVLLTAFMLVGLAEDELAWPVLVFNAVFFGVAVEAGVGMKSRRQRAQELLERAERAEREQLLLADRLVQSERTRIARELHDVVAHSLSVMLIQASAARRADDRQQVDALLSSIEDNGRQAMAEMRHVLGVLRDPLDHGDRSPQPSLAQLDELCQSDPSLPVRLHVEGDLSTVPASAELNAYRVVQEALTNVRRHGGRVCRVDVRVALNDDVLTVEVVDDGRGAASIPSAAGFGLKGMAERVHALGGELDAGPARDGGWKVRATFPAIAA
jgi:signal transduction histidine kinase